MINTRRQSGNNSNFSALVEPSPLSLRFLLVIKFKILLHNSTVKQIYSLISASSLLTKRQGSSKAETSKKARCWGPLLLIFYSICMTCQMIHQPCELSFSAATPPGPIVQIIETRKRSRPERTKSFEASPKPMRQRSEKKTIMPRKRITSMMSTNSTNSTPSARAPLNPYWR